MKKVLVIFLLLVTVISSDCLAQQRTKHQPPRKPVAEAAPAPQPEEAKVPPVAGDPSKDNVAIYPFTVASGFDYEYAQSVGNAVESGFVRSTRFNVLERSRFGSIKEEERFKEVNTDNVVRQAAKFGAKYVVTGHITGAATSPVYNSYDHSLGGYQTSISLAFKIIEVETGLIKVAENLNITGSAGSETQAKGNAIAKIDGITRNIIASYFPQKFKFMAIGATEVKKKQNVLTTFKFWGGSDNGIKPGDVVEVYFINYAVNPSTNKKVEEKNNIGWATITAINSGSTATCEVYKPQKYGAAMLEAVNKTPDLVVIEYTGHDRPRNFFGL